MHPRIIIILSAALASGCTNVGPARVGLSGGERSVLRARAVPPSGNGVLIESTATGGLRIRGAYRMDPAARTTVPLIRHLESGSRNPVVAIQVNGKTFTASVDTGASFSMITFAAAEQAGVAPLGPELIELPTVTFRGTQSPVLAVAEGLQLGGLSIKKVPFAILRRIPGMPMFPEDSLAAVDAILGQDLLRRFGRVLFEGPAHELQLDGSECDSTIPPGRVIDELPLTLGKTGIPSFQARISGRGPVPVVFDSGGGFGLWIPEHTARDLRLADAGGRFDLAVTRPLFKPSTSRPVRPSSLRAGEFVADALPTLIGMISGGEQNPDFAMLGNHILDTTSVAIDYRAGTILFLRK